MLRYDLRDVLWQQSRRQASVSVEEILLFPFHGLCLYVHAKIQRERNK